MSATTIQPTDLTYPAVIRLGYRGMATDPIRIDRPEDFGRGVAQRAGMRGVPQCVEIFTEDGWTQGKRAHYIGSRETPGLFATLGLD